jgi:hypothetical protein
MLDWSKDKSTKFEIIEKKYWNWLLAKTNWQFSIISSNETDNFIIVQRKHASFSFFIFIILFICFVIPALLYLFTLRQKAETFTIFINIDTGEVNSKDFDWKFLWKHPYYWIIKNYNNSLK